MQILSATEAISPAIVRTKLVLFSPFRVGRTWKLSATAYLSFAGTAFLPLMLVYGAIGWAVPGIPPLVRWIIVVVCLVLTATYTVVFWLCGHLKFAFFDIVLNRGEFVAPAWRKYTMQARRWTLVKIIAGSAIMVVLDAPVYLFIRRFIELAKGLGDLDAMKSGAPSGMPPVVLNFMLAFYGAYFVAAVLFCIYLLVWSTLSSFIVPPMALEGSTVKEAFARFTSFVRRETGAFLTFVGVRIGLAIAGYIALSFAYQLIFLILAAVVAAVCGVIGLLFHLAGISWAVALVICSVIFGAFFVGATGYLLIYAMGAFFTFFEAHTLYFLGGRYSLIGDLLDQSTPPPVVPVQPYPYNYNAPYAT